MCIWSTSHSERHSLNEQFAQMIERRAGSVIAMQRNREASEVRQAEERFAGSGALGQSEPGASSDTRST